MIEDLGSANGTFIGGQRLAPNNPGLVSEEQVVRVGMWKSATCPPAQWSSAQLRGQRPTGVAAEPAGAPVSVSLVGPPSRFGRAAWSPPR